ncbi:MAG TPA: SHOCT domain-containing protein [Vicinamibacterales bacterium]
MMGGGDVMMGGMWLWWIVGLGVLVLLVWAIARAAASPAPLQGGDSPEAILKRRYARGELDREEYDRRLSDLRK